MAYFPNEFVSLPAGIQPRSGFKTIAEFGEPVAELKVRNGRVTAKVGDIWHILPVERDKPEG